MVLEFYEIDFFEKIAFKFAENFLMELEYHKIFLKVFHRTRVYGTPVPWKT